MKEVRHKRPHIIQFHYMSVQNRHKHRNKKSIARDWRREEWLVGVGFLFWYSEEGLKFDNSDGWTTLQIY